MEPSLHGGKGTHMARKIRRSESRSVVDKRCDLYTAPAAGAVVPAFSPTNITWDPTCLTSSLSSLSTSGQLSTVDVYLYSSSQPVHVWSSQPFSSGSLSTQLDPRWWAAAQGSPSDSELSVVFCPAGQPIALTPFATGPTFDVDWDGTVPASASASAQPTVYTGPSVESTSDAGSRAGGGGLAGGKLAAAVVMPLLVVAAVIGGYIFWTRRKTSTDRKRWSAYVDDRMSVMSGATWKDGAPRPSLAHSRAGSLGGMSARTGASALPPSHLRNGSTINPDGTARPTSSIYAGTVSSPVRPSFQQPRPSTGGGDRNSRVSFAANDIPVPGSPASKRRSIYSGRGVPGPTPPLPADAASRSSYYASSAIAVASHGSVSPSPREGKVSLSPDSSSGGGGSIPLWMRFSTHGKGVGGHVANTSIGSLQLPPLPIGGPGSPLSPASPGEEDKEDLDERSLLGTPQRKGAGAALNADLSDVRAFARNSQASFALPQTPERAKVMDFNMPRAQRDSALSPDDAMASYARARQGSLPTPPTTPVTPEKESGNPFKAMIRKKSSKNLKG